MEWLEIVAVSGKTSLKSVVSGKYAVYVFKFPVFNFVVVSRTDKALLLTVCASLVKSVVASLIPKLKIGQTTIFTKI